MKIITIDDWQTIADALHYVRKAYNTSDTTDEKRLAEMEMYLKAALGMCKVIRERWGDAKRDKDRVI
jgi:hypothetical protein